MSETEYVVMPADRAFGLGRRIRTLERLVRELHHTIENERRMLDTALIQLAQARGEADTFTFRLRWLHDHRRATPATQGVPFTFLKNGREPA